MFPNVSLWSTGRPIGHRTRVCVYMYVCVCMAYIFRSVSMYCVQQKKRKRRRRRREGEGKRKEEKSELFSLRKQVTINIICWMKEREEFTRGRNCHIRLFFLWLQRVPFFLFLLLFSLFFQRNKCLNNQRLGSFAHVRQPSLWTCILLRRKTLEKKTVFNSIARDLSYHSQKK